MEDIQIRIMMVVIELIQTHPEKGPILEHFSDEYARYEDEINAETLMRLMRNLELHQNLCPHLLSKLMEG